VSAFRALPDFQRELAQFIAWLKATRPLPGQTVLAPGEASAQREAERRRGGIELPAATVADLQAELDHYALPIDLAAQGHATPLG
jgi:LDH2 family malate/lactate/ureidoglycolate dehydrogenase